MPHDTLAGRRVLLVEDEMLVMMLAEDMLEEAGCQVVATNSVGSSLRLLETDRAFDAAIIDLNLQGEMSNAVADALADAKIPFAFATGYGGAGLPAAYRDHPVLSKPYDQRALTAMLARLVGIGAAT